MICFFVGHRDTQSIIEPLLVDSVSRHIGEYGVKNFVVGCYGEFDRLAMHTVASLKEKYPEITLTRLAAYYPVNSDCELFDDTFYPPGMEFVPKRVAIVRANRYMIEHSDYLICYNRGIVGNTKKLVDFALRRETRGLIKVENLFSQV